ncbi:MAG: carbohydrate porin [Sediminibacterium sp.]|nr:MAG: carbohydrate-selective porin [Chitinophagaceae bacterium]MDP1842992.1 carbohydrate porin [Sediminibacterium sp.]
MANLFCLQAQSDTNLLNDKKGSIHFQSTIISQKNLPFHSPYSGQNSLLSQEPIRSSFSSTLFLNYKFAKKTYVVFNAEASGGKGISKTLGIAGFPNGEVYRVGNPAIQPFIARLYIEHRFNLSNEMVQVNDDINTIQEKTNRDYVSLIVGKFSLPDFFDDLPTSNDPRTEYFNWALMGSGGWDYPANTRGYTMGAVVQIIQHDWALKAAITTVPTEANGPHLELKWGKAMGTVIEWSKNNFIRKKQGNATLVHLGAFLNYAPMGNYNASLQLAGTGIPDITDTRKFGRKKWGFYAGLNSDFNHVHHFLSASWGDGKNETWAFTEIDRNVNTGFQWDGILWKRPNDKLAVAYSANFLSKPHHTYLAKGGYGFLLGDGQLNYGSEQIAEIYYSLHLLKKMFLTPDYQFIIHPGYNKDRGPVHVFALRLHLDM